MKKSKRIAIVFLFLWIVIYLSIDIIFNILGYCESSLIETVFGTINPFYVASSLLILYPLLFVIRHHAKKAQMKKMCILVGILIVIVTIWLSGVLICMAASPFVTMVSK